MNQAELLRYVVETLDTLGIDYMVSGSHASIYYGEPRMTQDIDVVADVTLAHLPALLERFAAPEFYVSEEAARDATATRGQFTIIHSLTGLKIILNKFLYFQEGGSERHLRDIAGMLRVSGPEIDTRYIGDWAQRLGVGDIWQAVRRRVET